MGQILGIDTTNLSRRRIGNRIMMRYCQIVFSALLLFFFTSTVAFTNNNILYNHQNNKRIRHIIDTKLHVEPAIIAVGALTTAGAICILNNNNNIQSKNTQQYADYEAREKERGRLAYITPKDTWSESELQPYNGSNDNETGPVLLAVKGEVYNVYKGRNFYGPGGDSIYQKESVSWYMEQEIGYNRL